MWNFAVVAPAVLCTFVLAGAGGHAIAPEALVGCRAPDEPNCARCCLESDSHARCVVRLGVEDWSLYDVDPWYNGVEVEDGPCAAECPRCARCSERAERELRALKPRPECDCATLSIGVDPCFSPGSCACHCRTLESLTWSCPPADRADECAPGGGDDT